MVVRYIGPLLTFTEVKPGVAKRAGQGEPSVGGLVLPIDGGRLIAVRLREIGWRFGSERQAVCRMREVLFAYWNPREAHL